MKRDLGGWARPAAAALALVMGLTCAAPSVAAAAEGPAAEKPTSLSEAARATLEKMDTTDAVVVTQSPGDSGESKPFFKTRKGMAALVVMVAGTAYTLYSKDKDRVRSPIR